MRHNVAVQPITLVMLWSAVVNQQSLATVHVNVTRLVFVRQAVPPRHNAPAEKFATMESAELNVT